ncbi:peptide ABC transporter substrate-binding protein [Cytobacillus sp. FJAT-53684]|uniref:Peptide ABC transporter substrate-binding protein n=1 Tax=Cytobacillus mangrovibacter TaxID=3299024 RepID=A0ABW6K2F9_9BACI
MKKNISAMLAVLLSLILILTGCFNSTEQVQKKKDEGQEEMESSEDNGPKILRTNNSSEPGSLHPGTAQGSHDSWILEHTFEGLTTKSPDGKIIPGMAELPEVSEDGLTWTFHLRDGMKWSNGDPVTAEDFEYAWKYALNPNTASQYAYQLYYLEGGEEFNSVSSNKENRQIPEEVLKPYRDKVGVKALDEKTLEVKLAKPTPYFLDLTSHYTYYPINKKVQEQNSDWYKEADTFVSNGAFTLSEWKHKESVKLVKNESYYDKDKINLDEVLLYIIEDQNTAWQMYQSDEMDLIVNLPAEVTGMLIDKEDPEFHNASDLATYYYNLNTGVKPFGNVKVRRALSMAIDRQAIVDHVSQGGQIPAYGVIPPGMPDESGDFRENAEQLFEESVEKAKKLLEEGLAEEGLDKMPKFSFLYNTSETHKAIAEAIQEMWRKNLGIEEMVLENAEFQVKLDREQAGDFQISRGGWIGDYVDPMTFMDIWVTDGPYNDVNWGNKEYDKLIQTAKSTMDKGTRMDAMHQAEQILMDEMPIIPIYYYSKPHAYKHFISSIYAPINRYPQFKYADIKK